MASSFCFALLPLALSLFSQPASSKSLERAIGGAATDLASHSVPRGARLSIGEIVNEQGRITALSLRIAETLEFHLIAGAERGGFSLVDRKNIGDLVKEWHLGDVGFVSAETAVPAGRILGVSALVAGRYSIYRRRVRVSANLIDTTTGKVLSHLQAEFKATKEDQAAAAMSAEDTSTLKSASTEGPKSDLVVELKSDKEVYRIGDMMHLSLRASRDSFLTVLSLGSSGNITVLYPNFHSRGNSISGQGSLNIPADHADYDLVVGGPKGTEIIRAIISPGPNVDLSDAVASLTAQSPFGAVKVPPGLFARDVHVKAKAAPPGQWAEATIKVNIQ